MIVFDFQDGGRPSSWIYYTYAIRCGDVAIEYLLR